LRGKEGQGKSAIPNVGAKGKEARIIRERWQSEEGSSHVQENELMFKASGTRVFIRKGSR